MCREIMAKLARSASFLFKFFNFFLDCFQTWQFVGGGGMSGVLTAIVAFYQKLPLWMLPIVTTLAVVTVTVSLALIFSAFTVKRHDNRVLPLLPRLVLDIHKRISAVRDNLVRKTNWDEVDTNKVTGALLDVFDGLNIDDGKIRELREKLTQSGSPSYGIAAVPNAIMKESDTSLELWLKRDVWYNILLAKLDSYKPYPNETIGNKVTRIINTSFSLNNALILQRYAPDSLTLTNLASVTKMSDVKRMQVYSTNVDAEKNIDDAVEKACSDLREIIAAYLDAKRG